jgi:Fe-Mn family superoxide dismutase
LVNQWAADHAHGLAGGVPILALDMYEHSYHMDFGSRATAYVDAVMANLQWERISARYHQASHGGVEDRTLFTPLGSPLEQEAVISVEELRDSMPSEQPVLIDVCLADDLGRRSDMLEGAILRNPDQTADWARSLPRDRPIIVYCVFGFQVSGGTVAGLRQQGFNVRSLKGGLAAWHAIGGRTVPLDRSTFDA